MIWIMLYNLCYEGEDYSSYIYITHRTIGQALLICIIIMTQCYVYYYDTMLCLRVQVLYLRVVGSQACNVAFIDNVRRQNIYALYRFQLAPFMM